MNLACDAMNRAHEFGMISKKTAIIDQLFIISNGKDTILMRIVANCVTYFTRGYILFYA